MSVDFVEIQRAQQIATYGGDPAELTGAEKAQYVRDMVLALQVEVVEILGCFKWKPWHSGHPLYGELLDEDKWEIIDEFGDIFCFIGCIAAAAGLTTEDLMDGFRRKVELNGKRHADTQAHQK